jgi:hypothetical protein
MVALNLVAVGYGSTNFVPFWALAKMFGLWAAVCLPLAVGGTIMGRRFGAVPSAPARVNPVPRPIPVRPWYRSPRFVCLLAGFLPFGSIFIETYFIFSSVSGTSCPRLAFAFAHCPAARRCPEPHASPPTTARRSSPRTSSTTCSASCSPCTSSSR